MTNPSPDPSCPVRPIPAPGDWASPILVLGLAIVLAAGFYAHFLTVSRHLWDNPTHDRNSHYLFALRLATDARQGNVLRFVDHLNQAAVWPPLHGLLAAGVLLAGGRDYRLAVLPSVAAWVAAVVLGFLVARRALPRGGTVAGLLAALFLAASPAHRAFATDLMLESLGACLSLAVLYAYLRAVQADGDGRTAGRWLALALTALFFHKYNYWLLLVLALAATEVVTRRRQIGPGLRAALVGCDVRRWGREEARRPLSWALLVLLVVIAAVGLGKPGPLSWGGWSVTLFPPHTLIYLAYLLFFLRLVSWWRARGRAWTTGLDARLQEVIRWHAWPAAVWLALPRHPSHFLWYLSLANADPRRPIDVVQGARTYARWLMEDYHHNLASTVLAGMLCGLGLLAWRRLRPGGAAVLWLVLLAGGLTVFHPNQKARNLHSWVAAGWVAGGIGLAILVYGPLTARWPRTRPWLAAAALGALAWMQWPALTNAGHALEGGPRPDHGSLLDLTEAYLPDLAGSGRAAVFGAAPVRALTQWAVLERCGRLDRLEEHWWGFADDRPGNRAAFTAWLRSTPCDTLVYVDRLPGRPRWEQGPECLLHADLLDLLRRQDAFHLVKERDFPDHCCRVQVWRRSSRPTADPGRPLSREATPPALRGGAYRAFFWTSPHPAGTIGPCPLCLEVVHESAHPGGRVVPDRPGGRRLGGGARGRRQTGSGLDAGGSRRPPLAGLAGRLRPRCRRARPAHRRPPRPRGPRRPRRPHNRRCPPDSPPPRHCGLGPPLPGRPHPGAGPEGGG